MKKLLVFGVLTVIFILLVNKHSERTYFLVP